MKSYRDVRVVIFLKKALVYHENNSRE